MTTNLIWHQRSNGSYRREDGKVSILLIHLNCGWRCCLYNRAIHAYAGEKDGYPTLEAAQSAASTLGL